MAVIEINQFNNIFDVCYSRLDSSLHFFNFLLFSLFSEQIWQKVTTSNRYQQILLLHLASVVYHSVTLPG